MTAPSPDPPTTRPSTGDPSTGVCETHLSRLFFSGDRVYKLLKPVVLPFVDFTDPAERIRAATKEFEENHAISPDVYLGVADLVEGGEVVDRMIVMRRLDSRNEFERLVRQRPQPERLRQVARRIATMHADLEPLRGADAWAANPESIATNWEDNLRDIGRVVGTVIDSDEYDEVAALAHRYMAGREELFRRRIADGWVRKGHGDLRAEHIYCTDDGPRLIDCVAFNDQLRISDALADVGFLAMDLDRLAGPEAAVALMSAWNEFTNESHPSSLAHFYVAYRAHVRCKIACINHLAGDPDAASVAREYHRLARRHLEHARLRLVLVGGGPGAGKSTVAEAVARGIGAVWLRVDEIRKDVAGIGHDQHDFSAPETGIYSAEVTEKTHAEVNRQTSLLLGRGLSVVVDSTWRSAGRRDTLRSLGERSAATISEIRCELPRAIAKERIARRMASVHNPSDATPDLVDFIGDRFDDWPTASPVSTAGSIRESQQAAVEVVLRRKPVVTTAQRFEVDIARLRDEILLRNEILLSASAMAGFRTDHHRP